MIITSAQKEQLKSLLPKDYKLVVVRRLKKKRIHVHPNTVQNALNGSNNATVAEEIIKLAMEIKASRDKVQSMMKQL